MNLGIVEQNAPSLFRRPPSAISKYAAYSALAILLMVVDIHFHFIAPIRQALSVVTQYSAQWVTIRPTQFIAIGNDYLQELKNVRHEANEIRRQMTAIALQIYDAKSLAEENTRLRNLLELRPQLPVPTRVAQVVYESPDNSSRRIVLDKGQIAGVLAGSPVMDEQGILGQVTRVQPFTSEVTLLIDRNQAIPVIIPRTGVSSVAYGEAASPHSSNAMELRFMPSDADVQPGDVLTTSGIDGIYPPDLPVAKVVRVERPPESPFIRIQCQPLARMQGSRHVVVLTPLDELKITPPALPTLFSETKKKMYEKKPAPFNMSSTVTSFNPDQGVA